MFRSAETSVGPRFAGARFLPRASSLIAAAVVASLLAPVPAHAALPPGGDGSWRFDFGTPTSPVGDGYQQVLIDSRHTAESGWGITLPEGESLFDRNRAGSRMPADPVAEDYIAGTDWGFLLDEVPSGEYDVTLTIGDALAGTSGTNATISLEGMAQTRLTTGRGATTQRTFRTLVEDGQLTVAFAGSGSGAFVNGLVVAPVVPSAPTALAATRIAWNGVYLTWAPVEGAVSYRILRADVHDGEPGGPVQVAESTQPGASDASVVAGQSYAYTVVAVDARGRSSAPSAPVTTDVILDLAVPAAPTGLAVSQVTLDAVVLTWGDVENVDEYVVERAAQDGVYSQLGVTASASFTDASVDTSTVWSYRISARNQAGASAPSAAVASSVHTTPVPLPEGDVVTFDFGPGAVAGGAVPVTSATGFGDDWGYGFTTAPTGADIDRGAVDPLRTDFVAAQGGTFEVQLGAGDYTVRVLAGDLTAVSDISITAEGISKVQPTSQATGSYLDMAFPIALVDGRLTLQFTGEAVALNALTITREPERAPASAHTLYLAGDSTVQTYTATFRPQAGWGQMVGRFFADDVTVANRAIGGRSSKNFISQGRLDEILRAIRPGDYLFVQFGHNDASQGVDDRYASPEDYKEYLRVYLEGTRQRGATPVLVTPVSRRSFNAETGSANVSFPEYVAKMTELAVEEDALLVDLSGSSRAYLDEIGPDAAKALYLHVDPGVFDNRPSGTADDTHFQEYGAIQMARLVAQGVKALTDPLAGKVVDASAPAEVPATPQAVVVGSISNAGAVIQWQPSPSADIYKLYRQAVADPDQTWSLVTYTTQSSVVVQGLLEGTTYRYRVVATNGRGDSEASASIAFTTKQAVWKYDIQPVGAPVMPGYTEVNSTSQYTPAIGWGFTAVTGFGDRDRGTGGVMTDLERDFVLPGSAGREFVLDVPNGTYSVKTYSGDRSGTSRTNFTIEGKAAGSGNAGSGAVNASVRGPFLVTDGQLNIFVDGAAARLNGLEITPILLGPVGLEVVDVDADPASPTVSLAWDGEPGFTWNVYRSSPFDTEPVLVDNVDEPQITDRSARVGLPYSYFVTALDQSDLESVPSSSVEVTLVDDETDPPAAPHDLALARIDERELEVAWTRAPGTVYELVFRSETAGEQGELVAVIEDGRFTDAGVLTTIPYFYTVIAVNAGGAGQPSEQLETPAVTVLQRQAEYLDRAPHAVSTEDGVLITWRMLGTDPDDIAFHIYRDGQRLTSEAITASTNYLDASGTAASHYFVTSVLGGVESTLTPPFAGQAAAYLGVPLQKPADAYTKDGQPYGYRANDVSVGDVDGDGQYELFVKWDPTNSKDNSNSGYTGNVYLDAYRLDGTLLWRIDLGVNIRAGAHYTQFQVYDLNGDGRAELFMKTGDGTIDGLGRAIGDPTADYRNSSGYILQGPEYLTAFDGLTGEALDTIDYVPVRGDVGAWGDTYGNRVDRFLAATAYLDGERPSVVFSRGYYTRAVLAAYDFDGAELTERWVIDSEDEDNAALAGMGNHNLSVADVDGDAKDEIVYGSATVDDDGELLYSTGLGHGDAIHVSDLVPGNPGLEVFAAHEEMNKSGNIGATMRDARTGDVLWSIPAIKDTGRAAAGDIDPRHAGAEGWAIGGDAAWNSPVGQLVSAEGEVISEEIPAGNFLAWFDGDPLREIVDHTWDEVAKTGAPTIAKWNWQTEQTDILLTDLGATSNNSTKGTPNLQVDLFGDWREEIAWRSLDSSELRIYSTSDATDIRLRTLMHDPVYRLGVAWQNTGYNQPPHTSYFLGEGMTPPAAPLIAVTGAPAGPEDATAPLLEGMPADGAVYADSDDLTLGITATDPESGVRNLDVAFDGAPVAANAVIDLAGRVGTHTLTVRAVNHRGLISASAVTIVVRGPDTTRPAATLVSPATGGPFSTLSIRVDATDERGLRRIVANIYRGDTLVKNTQTAVAGTSGTHAATVALPAGGYTIRYNAQDAAGNISVTGSFAVTVDTIAPTVTVKEGTAFTVGSADGYDVVSFKLYDAGMIDRLTLNGVAKNLTDNAWSDLNGVRPGAFGAHAGRNVLVVHDVAGNTTSVEFLLR